MLQTWGALLQSRKFWVGTLTIVAVIAGTVGLATHQLQLAGFVGFVSSVTAIGLTVIGSIAWEDSAQKTARFERLAAIRADRLNRKDDK